MTKTFSRVMLLVIAVAAGRLLFKSFTGAKESPKKSDIKKLAPKKAKAEAAEETTDEAAGEAGCCCTGLFSKLGFDPAALVKGAFAGPEK